MSLVRLLAAGRCLMGLKDKVGRYQPANPSSLPRFGGVANPFRGTVHPSRLAPPFNEPVVKPLVASGSPPSPRGGSEAAAPASTAAKEDKTKASGFPGPICRADLPVNQGWLKRTISFFRLGGQKSPKWQGAARRMPVQVELRLEQVKVVRNDLSDTDLEVVAAKPVKAAATERADIFGAVRARLGSVAVAGKGAGRGVFAGTAQPPAGLSDPPKRVN